MDGAITNLGKLGKYQGEFLLSKGTLVTPVEDQKKDEISLFRVAILPAQSELSAVCLAAAAGSEYSYHYHAAPQYGLAPTVSRINYSASGGRFEPT